MTLRERWIQVASTFPHNLVDLPGNVPARIHYLFLKEMLPHIFLLCTFQDNVRAITLFFITASTKCASIPRLVTKDHFPHSPCILSQSWACTFYMTQCTEFCSMWYKSTIQHGSGCGKTSHAGLCPLSNKAYITCVRFKDPPRLSCPLPLSTPPDMGKKWDMRLKCSLTTTSSPSPLSCKSWWDCTLSVMEEDTQQWMPPHPSLRCECTTVIALLLLGTGTAMCGQAAVSRWVWGSVFTSPNDMVDDCQSVFLM